MASDRRSMTARVVPFRSREADEVPVPASAAERLRLILELSASAWSVAGRAAPPIPRAAMRCVLRPLREPPAERQ